MQGNLLCVHAVLKAVDVQKSFSQVLKVANNLQDHLFSTDLLANCLPYLKWHLELTICCVIIKKSIHLFFWLHDAFKKCFTAESLFLSSPSALQL